MLECKTHSLLTIPYQTIQEVSDRMVAVSVRCDMDRFFDQLHGAEAISPLAVQMDIVDVIVCAGLTIAGTFPSKLLHYIYSLCQLIETDSSFQDRIV